MLPIRQRSGSTGFFFFFIILSLILIPLTADARSKGQRTYHSSIQKKAFHHGKQKSGNVHARRGGQGKVAKRYPPPVDTSTANYADLVMEAKTGRILHATEPDELRHPASLTKMMTLYLTFEALKKGQLDLDHRLPISQHAASQSPSKLGLKPGNSIRVEDALLGMVTKSANDATVVLSEALGGTEESFARMMTAKARELGMHRTVFRNASGLPDPDQVTTARDMAVLGYALVYHFPQYYPYFSRDGFNYAGKHHNNHNNLMKRYQGMDGIKTGYIRASGFNLVASSMRGQTRLIAVVFGGRSAVQRDNHMAVLMDQAFGKVREEQRQQVAANDDKGQDSAANNVTMPKKAGSGPQQMAKRANF
ncbi:MAG: D-alanyl-D-alanine carboxypeptidase [Magnetococcales bacterium]|nr:D-alanyl-D-alanine carboxypeptidase [Magnetococcales bacterium]